MSSGSDWIDEVLRPALVNLDQREWTLDSFMEFHRFWNRRIHAALVAGDLTLEQVDEAHAVLDAAMPSVPGIAFKRQTARIAAHRGPGPVVRRRVPDN